MKLRMIYLMLGLTLCFNQTSYAQQKKASNTINTEKEVSQTLIAHWKKGETKTYSITHTKVKREDGAKNDSTSLTYWATITVTDSSSDGYHLNWNYILPPSGLIIPHSNEIYEFYKGLNIRFETSETGEFKGVINWQELRDHYVKMFELSIPSKNDGKVDSALEKVKQMFNSRQMVEGTMAREVILLLQCYGNTYTTKGTTVTTSLPNPFIPVKPIPALYSVKISEINPKLDYLKLRIEQSIDKDAAFQLFESVFDKMNLPKDSAMGKASDMLSNFEITDYCEIRATIKSAWVTSLYFIRTASSSGLSQKDSYFIEEKKSN